MRLVIDGRRLTAARTGVGRYLETLLAAWAEVGPPLPRPIVALHQRTGLERVPEGFEPIVIGEGWPGLAWEQYGLRRLLRPNDLLFAPTNLMPAGWRGRTALVLFDALMEARPGDFPRSVRWRFRGRYRWAARSAEVVIVPSQATAGDARRFYGVPSDRLRVVYPCPDPAFRPLEENSPHRRVVRDAIGLGDSPFWLFLGKRSRRRNVTAVREAFARHRRRFPDHRLVFAGPGSDRVEGPGILDAGHVPDRLLPALVALALGVLYPSEMEGFGLPVVEAMAAGCPVVTLGRGALLESGGDAAVFLDEAEPGAMADAMERLATDPAWRHDRIRRGLAHASRFGRGEFAEGVASILRDLAGGVSDVAA